MSKYEEYKYHPRILELRVVLYYTMLVRQYGVSKAVEFYKAICNITAVDWQKINGLINQMPKIRYLEKINRKRFRQELVFMGSIYEESRYFIARFVLNVSPATMYRKEAGLNLESFVDADWLSELDNNVTICGIPQYGLEARRFIENFSTFMETLGNVSAPKI